MNTSSWQRLLVLFAGVSVLESMFYGQLGSFIPLHLPELGIAHGQVEYWTGAIASGSALIGIPFVPLWGTLADRYSRKIIIVRSFAVHVISIAIMASAQNIWVFALGRVLLGLAQGDTALMLASLAERTPSNRLGLAFAVINGTLSVGAFSGSLIGGPIVDRYGFSTLMTGAGVLLFGVMLVLIFGFRDLPRPRVRKPILAMAVESVHIVLREPKLRTLFAGQLALGTGWMLVNTYAPLVITSLYSGPDPGTVIGAVMAAGGVGTLLLSPMIGSIADRRGYWRVLLAVVSTLIGVWLVFGLVRSLAAFVPMWAALNGVMSSVFSISFNVLSDTVEDSNRGRIMAFAYLPMNFGAFLGSGLGSLITGFGVFTVFPAAALCTAAGLLLLRHARRLAGR